MPITAGAPLPHSLPSHTDPTEVCEGPFWGTSWEINLVGDPKGDCSKRRKSQGQEKLTYFQGITSKNWNARRHVRYELQHVKRVFPAQTKHQKETDQSVSCAEIWWQDCEWVVLCFRIFKVFYMEHEFHI